MVTEKLAVDWEIIDHGMMLSDYFGGCGTCGTHYDECITGIGDNPREALLDAMAIAEDMGWNLERMGSDMDDAPETPSVSAIEEETGQDMEDVFYFVSIRLESFNPNKRRL